jgi:hypothetical protein
MPTYEEIWGKGFSAERDLDALRRTFDPLNIGRTIGSGAQSLVAGIGGIPGDLSNALAGKGAVQRVVQDGEGFRPGMAQPSQSMFPTYRDLEKSLSGLTGLPYERPGVTDPAAIAAFPMLRLAGMLPMLLFGGAAQQPAHAPQPAQSSGGIFGGALQSYQQPGGWLRQYRDTDANGFPDTGPLR